ncbi:MAG: IS110 family transposase [Euryarchaeota archaeon]|nr:IS110 family transposase [Euryarchaeota archaeon]
MSIRDNEQFVVKGSRYRIVSESGDDKPMVSIGEFRGYAAFASEIALCLKMDSSDGKEGRMRFIPYHAILAIDVLTMASQKVSNESEESQAYYC